MNDEQINHAIDEAISELLDVEPRPNLRARVIAQIEGSGGASAWTLRVVVPAAAAVVAVGALAVLGPAWRPAEPAPPPTLVAHATATPEPATNTSGTSIANVRPHALANAGPSRSRVSPALPYSSGRAVAATVERSDTSGVAPLDPIAPIRVAAVATSDITPQPIAIEPLAPITDVQIAPLTPPDGRQ